MATGGLFHGIQLWVNLPRADKLIPPRYQVIGRSSVALVSSPDGGALLRVIAGEVGGHQGPGSTHSPMAMVHATLSPGARLDIPWAREFNALVYVLAGAGSVGPDGRPVRTGQAVLFGPGDAITVAAGGPSVPQPLLDQLAVGGRLVIPVGSTHRLQELVRIERTSRIEYQQEDLGGVTFVALIGAEGWTPIVACHPSCRTSRTRGGAIADAGNAASV